MSRPADDPDVDFDPDTGTYSATFDPTSGRPSVQLLEAVGAIRDVDPTALAPLDDHVDPDALDALFEPTQAIRDAHASVSFVYEGFHVVVHSDGEIEFRERV